VPTELSAHLEDQSDQRGFQFRFVCPKCRRAVMSTYRTSKSNLVATVFKTAGNVLGGLLGRAASSADELGRAASGPEHAAALRDAIDEVKPAFRQCPRCDRWLCIASCWDGGADLCEDCAPRRTDVCPKCQATGQNDKFCAQCGSALRGDDKTKCWACDGEVAPEARFCPHCGEKQR
jgi:hypothetical protein